MYILNSFILNSYIINNKKPYISSKISNYLSEYDIQKNIKNLNHLIEINMLCNEELIIGQSVSTIDDDLIGRIKEKLENDEYLIELNNGEIIKKKIDLIIPNIL